MRAGPQGRLPVQDQANNRIEATDYGHRHVAVDGPPVSAGPRLWVDLRGQRGIESLRCRRARLQPLVVGAALILEPAVEAGESALVYLRVVDAEGAVRGDRLHEVDGL